MCQGRTGNIPGSLDGNEIVVSDPSVPMVHELGMSGIVILELAERVLVDDGGVACVLEKGWRDPRFYPGPSGIAR